MRALPMFVLGALLASPVSDHADSMPPAGRMSDSVPQIELPEIRVCRVLVTAYNSEVSQTDDTPHVTSSQTKARRGVVAARWLPIGTRVLIPGYGGADLLVVEDRMPPKNWCKLDLWMEEIAQAELWGKQFTDIIVVGAPKGFTCPDRPSTVSHKCPQPESLWARRSAEPVRVASVQP